MYLSWEEVGVGREIKSVWGTGCFLTARAFFRRRNLFVNLSKLFEEKSFVLSFEVFPPKAEQAFEQMYKAVDKLMAYKPGFISCTYGAGGTTRDQTLNIVSAIRERFPVTAMAHFTCVGSTVADIRAWLTEARERKVENIMALRGDPPKGETTFRAVEGGLRYASELVKLIHDEFPEFGIGVAGYPETHQEARSSQDDLDNLKRKVDNGASAIFTQLFYSNDDFYRFRNKCDQMGINVPIVPGLLPVLTLAQVTRITSLCKAKLPDSLIQALLEHENDPAGQMQVGIDHCREQCRLLIEGGAPGLHFYILNRADSACKILDGLDRLPTG